MIENLKHRLMLTTEDFNRGRDALYIAYWLGERQASRYFNGQRFVYADDKLRVTSQSRPIGGYVELTVEVPLTGKFFKVFEGAKTDRGICTYFHWYWGWEHRLEALGRDAMRQANRQLRRELEAAHA